MYKPVVTVFLVSLYVCFSLSSTEDLFAQERGTISVLQATALPLVNSEGNQVKVVINYSIGDVSIVGQKLNAVMGIYDRINGTLIKLSSFPEGFILNNTAGTIQLASTLTDPKIENISTIVTLTNADKSEKYSNDIRSDLDLSAILPTSLPGTTLSETLVPPPPSTVNSGEDQESDSSEDDSNSGEE